MNKVNHVAIIMDGNGRWALKRNKPSAAQRRNINKKAHFPNIVY